MEQEKIDPVYKKGFEHGYWMQRADNLALKQVMTAQVKNADYFDGLKAGGKEAMREQFKDRMNKSKQQSKDKGKDLDIG